MTPPPVRPRYLARSTTLGASALLSLAAACGSPVARIVDSEPFTDTLRLYYVGYPVGFETASFGLAGDGFVFTAALDYVDRGRRNRVTSELRTDDRSAPTLLEVVRITDDSSEVQTHVELLGDAAVVTSGGEATSVALPDAHFAIAGLQPVSQHLALVRYWLANGEPQTVGIVPGRPVNDVHIERRGRDTLALDGKPVVLDRFMVEGVVWGRESVWLDSRQRLAAFTSGGGGGLTFEAVRLELDPLFPELVRIATRDRMEDLARLTAPVEKVVSGSSVTGLALVGATLVDGRGGPAVEGATVLVSEGRIVAAGRDVSVPDGVETFDVRGKTIVPGLWDMHAHVMQVEWAPVYLAAGVTTVRDMGNTLPFITEFRDALRAGRGLGPRLLLAGLIDGGGPDAFGAVNATTPEEGRAAVRRYHEMGFEQMKLYSLLRPDVVGAIADEAHRLGMTVTGHVPRALTLLEALDAGMDQVAHLPINGDVRSDSIRDLIRAVAKRRAVIDPTVSWGEVLRRSFDEPMESFQPGVAYLPPALDQRVRGWGADVDLETAHARRAGTLSVIKALHDADVPLVVGTDEGVPGFSVYRDIELYVLAGLTPMDALRAATAVPAQTMGMADDVGTVEVGKRADLLVLDANPLDDISNIRSGRFVMIGGDVYRSADLWRAVGFRTAN